MLNELYELLNAVNELEAKHGSAVVDADVEGYFHDLKADIQHSIDKIEDEMPAGDKYAEHRLTKHQLGLA